jgi:hypothetical protein
VWRHICGNSADPVSRDDYVQRAEQQAVAGYAYPGLDGVWEAPGEMGWFGISSDREEDRTAYLTRTNGHLDSLDTETSERLGRHRWKIERSISWHLATAASRSDTTGRAHTSWPSSASLRH